MDAAESHPPIKDVILGAVRSVVAKMLPQLATPEFATAAAIFRAVLARAGWLLPHHFETPTVALATCPDYTRLDVLKLALDVALHPEASAAVREATIAVSGAAVVAAAASRRAPFPLNTLRAPPSGHPAAPDGRPA